MLSCTLQSSGWKRNKKAQWDGVGSGRSKSSIFLRKVALPYTQLCVCVCYPGICPLFLSLRSYFSRQNFSRYCIKGVLHSRYLAVLVCTVYITPLKVCASVCSPYFFRRLKVSLKWVKCFHNVLVLWDFL